MCFLYIIVFNKFNSIISNESDSFPFPGMVMQLYSWLQEHPKATKMEIDNILDGNICRYITNMVYFETENQIKYKNTIFFIKS